MQILDDATTFHKLQAQVGSTPAVAYADLQVSFGQNPVWFFELFRFINTFIDDLFAFVIRMPTLYRIG